MTYPFIEEKYKYSQTCVQQPSLESEKCGRYAEGCKKKIPGKKAQGWSLWLHTTKFFLFKFDCI
jgi:hypothetical protein